MTNTVTKKVSLNLVGLDSNALSLMAAFSKQARKEGWTRGEIKEVMDDCSSGDYDHLLCVLTDHCKDSDSEDEDDEEDDEKDED